MELTQTLLPFLADDSSLPGEAIDRDDAVNILLVDDSPMNLLLLEATLGVLGHNLVKAASGEAALEAVRQHTFAVILLDVQLPGLNGFEIASRLREFPETEHTPIIFLTGSETTEFHVVKGYAVGAVDYMLKPFAPEVLTAKVRAFVELFRKSAALRRQGELLRRQRELFRNILNCVGVGVAVADAHGRLVLVNPAGERLLGYGPSPLPPEEWVARIGLFLPDGVTPFPVDQLPLVRAVRGEESHDVEAFVRNDRRPEGTFLLATDRPLRDERGRLCGGVAVFRDITERRQAEEAVRQLNLDLCASNRDLQAANRELEAFSYSASHDLRAPLRGIDGFAKALWEDYGDKLDERATDYLRRVVNAAGRMDRLIDGLLALSRVTRSEMTAASVDLSNLARHTAEELRRREPQRDVDVVIADGLQARGDTHLLSLILDNLLGNAWKYTSKRRGARIEVGGQRNTDGSALFFVRDNGAGFDMAFAGKLFGPFQRLHSQNEFPGTGVGLATVQRIVHRHGGRIWAEAEPDRGAAFFFTL